MGCVQGSTRVFIVDDAVDGQGSEILNLMVKLRLVEDDINKLWTAFCELDETACGQVSVQLFHKFYKLEQTPFTEKVFALINTSGSGFINFEEYIIAMWNFLSCDMRSLAAFAFSMFDKDSSKFLEKDEVETLVCSVYGRQIEAHDRVAKMLEKLDANDDGNVSQEEFVEFSKRYPLILYPAYAIQKKLRTHVFGEDYWNGITNERNKYMADATIFEILSKANQQEARPVSQTAHTFKGIQSRQSDAHMLRPYGNS